MAFTTTLLAWSVIEFGDSMHNQLDNAKAAVRWSTDYLLKAATATPDTLYVQVRETYYTGSIKYLDYTCNEAILWATNNDIKLKRSAYSSHMFWWL